MNYLHRAFLSLMIVGSTLVTVSLVTKFSMLYFSIILLVIGIVGFIAIPNKEDKENK